jgi:hypothetical protein
MKKRSTHQSAPYSLAVITAMAVVARKSCKVEHALRNAHRPWLSAGRCGMVYGRRSFKSECPSALHEDCLLICREESILTPIVVHISCHLSAEAKTEESVILVLARNGHHIPAVIGQIHEHASHRYEPQEHAPHKYMPHGACTSWGVYLIGVCLIGRVPHGRVPHRRVPHRACTSWTCTS